MMMRRSPARPPLIILSLPRSFTSTVCAMIGQHPEMYGLTETHLFCEDTMARWLGRAKRAPWPMPDGLLRLVAQLYFGRQTADTVRLAREWLQSHSTESTGHVLSLLLDRLYPLTAVEKSPSTTDDMRAMNRTVAFCPDARYLFLLRDPRTFGRSVADLVREHLATGPLPARHWLFALGAAPAAAGKLAPSPGTLPRIADVQQTWYSRNARIMDFLDTLPEDRQLRVRGEDLLARPREAMAEVASWMTLRTDEPAIDAMLHPERSPYASLGPSGARYGNDGHFLLSPSLKTSAPPATGQGVDRPLPLALDGEQLSPSVRRLASELGYV